MRTLASIITVAAAVVTGPAFAVQQPVGRVVAVQGEAHAVRQAAHQEVNLTLKSPIFLNDTVATGADSKLQIMFNDQTVISQGENSEMVIDKYVYSPRSAAESETSTKFRKGVFRLVTGKIADLNPKRFSVQTRRATIGIRGTELGLDLRDVDDEIYLLALHKRKITIQGSAQPRIFRRPGTIVRVGEDGALRHARFAADAAQEILNAVTPKHVGDPADGGPGVVGRAIGAGGVGEDPVIVAEAVEPGATVDRLTDERLALMRVVATEQQAKALDSDQQVAAHGAKPQDVVPDPAAASTQDAVPAPPQDAVPAPPQDVVPDPPPAPISGLVTLDSGTDWTWGLWHTDGAPNLDQGLSVSGNEIGGAEYIALQNGLTRYALEGVGSAAAVLTQDGNRRLVQGSGSVNVSLGLGIAPTWGQAVAMNNNAGDSLNFTAVGNILGNGTLVGGTTAYAMSVMGSQYGKASITSESISGKLVGPGTGAAPITGAIGAFDFDHGGAAGASGIFASDLAAPSGQ